MEKKQSNITGNEKCFIGKGVEEEYMMKKPYTLDDLIIKLIIFVIVNLM